MPTLLVAPSQLNEPPDLYSDYPQGYYADGAYAAAPAPGGNSAVTEHQEDEDLDPQEAYYASLCTRFTELSTFPRTPPPDLANHPASTTAQSLNSGSNHRWRSVLNTQPSMALIGHLSQDAVLHGLQILETRLTKENLLNKQQLGLWAWGLLARCRDAGQMGSEEIGILRDLGKKAVWLLRGLQAGLERAGTDDEIDSQSDSADDEASGRKEEASERATAAAPPEDGLMAESSSPNAAVEELSRAETHPPNADTLEAVKARMLASLPSQSKPPKATSSPGPSPTEEVVSREEDEEGKEEEQVQKLQVTLDMIITIIGELYGQRDLLDGRFVWGEFD